MTCSKKTHPMPKKSSSSFDKPSFLEATKVPAIREVKIAGKSCKVKDIYAEEGGEAYPWLAATAMPPGATIQAVSKKIQCRDGKDPSMKVEFIGVPESAQVVAWAADGTAGAESMDQYEAYSPTNVFTGTAGSNGTLDATLCMPSGYTKRIKGHAILKLESHLHYRVSAPEKHLLGPVLTVNLDDCADE